MASRTGIVLGEFEVVVLLAVLALGERNQAAYGSTIRDEIVARANRRIARGAIYVTLDRLESKALLTSRRGDGGRARDDRPRRLFRVTPLGLRSVRKAVSLVNSLQRGLEPILEPR